MMVNRAYNNQRNRRNRRGHGRWGLWFWLTFSWLLAPVLAQSEAWQPFAMPWDAAPVNLSFLLDPPAGKHGFLDIQDGKFEFEDGTPARFWGTTISGAACFPSHDQAPLIAERLSQLGINLVRLQSMDAPWAEISLFTLHANQQLVLNPLALNRLDYFLYQLTNRGIYAYLDGLDARAAQAGEHIPYFNAIPPGFPGYIHFVPKLRQLHKAFLEEFWSHRSDYTQKEYRDTPSIILTDLFLENSFSALPEIHPYYIPLLEARWKPWCARHRIDPAPPFVFPPKTPEEEQFLRELTATSCQEMASFLRSLSVKCPIGASVPIFSTGDLAVQRPLNFSTAHQEMPFHLGKNILVENGRLSLLDCIANPNPFSILAMARLEKKPFVVGRWGMPWPNPYRAEMPLWMAAMACFQDWAICVGSTYTSLSDQKTDAIQGPLGALNDPCTIGLYPAAALLFHANEIKPAKQEVGMALGASIGPDQVVSVSDALPPRLVGRVKYHTLLDAKPSGKWILGPTEPLENLLSRVKPSPPFFHDDKRGLVVINTPKCQALIGALSQSEASDLADLDLESEEEFGVLCVASLDGKALSQSRDLWITLVSQAKNTGFQSQKVAEYSILKEPGTGPILLRETPVRLFLRTKHAGWRLNSILANADHLDSIPFQIQDEVLSFRAGTHGTMYYRLTCTP